MKGPFKKIGIMSAVLVLLSVGGFTWYRLQRPETEPTGETESAAENKNEQPFEVAVKDPVPVTDAEAKATPMVATALGGYDVLIADKGNNRIIEVTPDKHIVWEYDFDLPRPGLGADDAFFADGGKTIVAGMEDWNMIMLIDYATKNVIWEYGTPGMPGSKDGQLNTPDDPYKLPNGNITVADIKNCRVIEISPDKKIVRQYGTPGKCSNRPGFLNKPNGDTPLPNGHTLVSNIVGHSLLELDENWKPVFSMSLPLQYPSDPQMTKAGNILIAGYTNPGKIMEVSKDGKIVWQQAETSGPLRMKFPSLAIELPNGNILANDDDNDRVIVIDKATHAILWQYGVVGKPGRSPGQVNDPDGVDIIMHGDATVSSGPAAVPTAKAGRVGDVSRHPLQFVGKSVTVNGYSLKSEGDYVIISDEATGIPGYYDMPVFGTGISVVMPKKLYAFTGMFVGDTQKTGKRSPYHLELSQPPTEVAP